MPETRFTLNRYQVLFWIIILAALFSRLPVLEHETFHGSHCWKSVRHYQFAQNMLIHHNYLYGLANFNQPEVDLRWQGKMWNWIYKVTEAPLLDWALVIAFKLFGVSVYNFYLTLIAIATLTCVALFYMIQRLFSEPLALLGTLLFAMVPLYVYFSQTGLGENLIHAALILYTISIVMLLDRFNLGRYLFFIFACCFSVLCKGTTGGLLAWLIFSTVHVVLAVRHREALRGMLARRKALIIALGGLFLLVNVATLYMALDLFFIHSAWPLESRPGGLFAFFVRRAKIEIGLPVLVPLLCAVAFYSVRLAWAWLSGRQGTLTNPEIACLILLTAAYLQFAIQFRPATGHQFYQTTLLIPSILIALAALHRMKTDGYRKTGLLLFGAMLLLFAVKSPQARSYVQYCYQNPGIAEADEQALRDLFKDRLKEHPKYFVLTFHPVWAYYAGTLAVQVGSWEGVGAMLLKSVPDTRSLVKRLGIEYIIFPTAPMPREVMEALRTNPNVGWGPASYGARLVYQGDTVCVFQIVK